MDKAFNRPSILKRFAVGNQVIDLVKSNHFMDRYHVRNFNFDDVLSVAEKAMDKALQAWIARNFDNKMEGVIQWRNLNVMFGVAINNQTKHVDYVLISAIEKTNFFVKNKSDVVIKV